MTVARGWLRSCAALLFVSSGALAPTACSRPADVNAQETSAPAPFRIEEATIASVHNAITSGQTTCRAVVQAYLDRARAYNGVCTALITADGKPIPPVTGAVRAGAPQKFPTQTVAVATIFPDYDKYQGLPLELGRMEPTASDPS